MSRRRSKATEWLEPARPGAFLRACVPLLLREERAHGYEILERLGAFGASEWEEHAHYGDPGAVYRVLRGLEEEGLVSSAWEHSARGGDRRTYDLAEAGLEEPDQRARGLAETADTLHAFLGRYGQVAMRHSRGAYAGRDARRPKHRRRQRRLPKPRECDRASPSGGGP